MKELLSNLNRNRLFIQANVVLLFVLLNGVASAWNCRWDWSRDRVNSVTSSTSKVLNGLKDPVLVEAYISTDLPGELRSPISPILSQLDEIGRVGGRKVILRVINPDTDEKRKDAEARGVQGIPFEQSRPDEVTQRLGYFGIYVQTGEKSAVLNLVEEGRIIEDFEYKFLREIKRLTRKEGPSGIGYLKVAGTSDARRWQSFQDQDKDNMYFFHALLEEEFGQVTNVELLGPVDKDVETLIIAGAPRLDDKQAYYIDQFLMRGGNLVCMLKAFEFDLPGDPRQAQMGNGGGFASVQKPELDRLNKFISHYGVALRGEILFEPQLAAQEVDMQARYAVRNPAWALYSRDNGNLQGELASMRNIEQIVLPWFSGLDLDEKRQPNVTFIPLIASSPDAITKDAAPIGLREMQRIGKDPTDTRVESPALLGVFARGKFQSAFTEKSLPPGESAENFRAGQSGSTQSSILMLGTPYLVSDYFLRNEASLQIFKVNQAFVMNFVESAQGDTDLAAARSRVAGLDYMRPRFPDDEKLQKWFERIFAWLHTLLIPVGLGVYGWRRLSERNQRKGLEDAK